MDLIQLKYFIRVAELRSLSKAAIALHVAQPAITRQIRLLEEELGVSLLLRHSRGSEPTEAGIRLKQGAESILRLTEQVRSDVISTALTPVGTVRVGFPASVGNLLMGSTLCIYRGLYPKVLVTLAEGYNQVLQAGLLSDRIDIAIMTCFESHPLLSTQALYDEQLWLLGARRPQGIRKNSFTVADLHSLPLIQTGHENIVYRTLSKAAEQQHIDLNIVIQSESLSMIKDLVSRGAGYHVSPYSAVVDDVGKDGFWGGPIPELSISRVLTYRNDRPMTRAVTAMISLIIEELHRAAIASASAIRLSPNLDEMKTVIISRT